MQTHHESRRRGNKNNSIDGDNNDKLNDNNGVGFAIRQKGTLRKYVKTLRLFQLAKYYSYSIMTLLSCLKNKISWFLNVFYCIISLLYSFPAVHRLKSDVNKVSNTPWVIPLGGGESPRHGARRVTGTAIVLWFSSRLLEEVQHKSDSKA